MSTLRSKPINQNLELSTRVHVFLYYDLGNSSKVLTQALELAAIMWGTMLHYMLELTTQNKKKTLGGSVLKKKDWQPEILKKKTLGSSVLKKVVWDMADSLAAVVLSSHYIFTQFDSSMVAVGSNRILCIYFTIGLLLNVKQFYLI